MDAKMKKGNKKQEVMKKKKLKEGQENQIPKFLLKAKNKKEKEVKPQKEGEEKTK